MLVTTGEFCGTVWAASCLAGTDGDYMPAYRPAGTAGDGAAQLPSLSAPPTFSEWYGGWTEQALADLPVRRGWLHKLFTGAG